MTMTDLFVALFFLLHHFIIIIISRLYHGERSHDPSLLCELSIDCFRFRKRRPMSRLTQHGSLCSPGQHPELPCSFRPIQWSTLYSFGRWPRAFLVARFWSHYSNHSASIFNDGQHCQRSNRVHRPGVSIPLLIQSAVASPFLLGYHFGLSAPVNSRYSPWRSHPNGWKWLTGAN